MSNSISISKALSLQLGSLVQAVITQYELGVLVYKLYRTKMLHDQPLRTSKEYPQRREFERCVGELLKRGILSPVNEFPSHRVFHIIGKTASAEEMACAIDPFAYVSHLSAMDYHGLTDRMPRVLYLTSPTEAVWKEFAAIRMKRDYKQFYDEYRVSGFPKLRKLAMSKLEKRPVQCQGTGKHLGAYRNVRDRVLRVSTLGRTFLDMVRHPSLCGGMAHVLDVYDQFASSNLRLIVDEVNRNGTPIDKVRVGYILDERCRLASSSLQEWEANIQRGGSRKLVANAEYNTEYSEKWSLSINVD
ncbi:MAG: hypothetical protein OXI63_19955 [Candidatus Poribacteria bacterium]|nr:hypothetical protein [Candidatus Poribacteria bacterium]